MLETIAGLAFILSPTAPASLLLGVPLDTPAGLALARVAGAALLSLGIVCWLMRHEGRTPSGRAVVAAMLVYNIVVVAVLAHARLGAGMTGGFLGLAMMLHTVMAAWCVVCLRPVTATDRDRTPP